VNGKEEEEGRLINHKRMEFKLSKKPHEESYENSLEMT
jgi:hypothetical protein